jgi:hypothetical protein
MEGNIMSCYASRTSHRIGGIFKTADGSFRVIPDHWLNSAELLNDATLLRLNYSFCSVEISGYRLDGIYNDTASGKLGAVTIAADAVPDTAESGISVTSIVYVPAPFASSAEVRSNA